MIAERLKYYARVLKRDPNLDFFSEGLGISARAKRSANFWAKHLEYSADFVQRNLSKYAFDAKSVAILGAGRLLDVPAEFLLQHACERMYLIDADDGCLPIWQPYIKRAAEFGITVEPMIFDVTARFSTWTENLTRNLRRIDDAAHLAEALNALTMLECAPPSLPLAEIVISMNILSQLGVYWRQRVHSLLPRKLKSANVLENQKVKEALDICCETLEREHLFFLLCQEPKLLVMLSDDEWYYYQKDKAPWHSERALTSGIYEQIEGFELVSEDSWLWHLAPQGIEFKTYGAIHRVQARAWKRKDYGGWPV